MTVRNETLRARHAVGALQLSLGLTCQLHGARGQAPAKLHARGPTGSTRKKTGDRFPRFQIPRKTLTLLAPPGAVRDSWALPGDARCGLRGSLHAADALSRERAPEDRAAGLTPPAVN